MGSLPPAQYRSQTLMDGARPGPTTPGQHWRRDALESLQRELDTLGKGAAKREASTRGYASDTGHHYDTYRSNYGTPRLLSPQPHRQHLHSPLSSPFSDYQNDLRRLSGASAGGIQTSTSFRFQSTAQASSAQTSGQRFLFSPTYAANSSN